jgi:hypothetical protein
MILGIKTFKILNKLSEYQQIACRYPLVSMHGHQDTIISWMDLATLFMMFMIDACTSLMELRSPGMTNRISYGDSDLKGKLLCNSYAYMNNVLN